MNRRKICIVTGTRAEYGLLYWLMKEIQEDSELELQIIATAMHLSPEFGLTYKIIEQDGFTIHSKIEMLLSSDSPVGVTKSMGVGLCGFADAFQTLKPDVVVLLGDRYEILAAAQAAMVANIPIAHLHGGESTEGQIDEAIRHSVTKMSHLHFVSTDPYRRRVIQLGEAPERVFNFGALGIDNINRLSLLEREDFEKSINFRLADKNFLVTYHPVTLDDSDPSLPLQQLFDALDAFPEVHIIVTKPNSDMNGRLIARKIDEYAAKQQERVLAVTSLGQLRYLSAIRWVDVVIGNSSSGIIEAPYFKKPTVNVGKRQLGRLKCESVIDVQDNKDDIISAIRLALSEPFLRKISNVKSLYGDGSASTRIKEVLKTVNLEGILLKKFNDLPQSHSC